MTKITILTVLLLCSTDAAAVAQGCEYDTQCKGDRICENNMCVSPTSGGMNSPMNSGSAPQTAFQPSGVLTPIGGGQQLPMPAGAMSFAVTPEVRGHLDWCARDWGTNEGAQEAIRFINAAVAAGYPNQVSAIVGFVNEIPGVAQNALKRPPILDAAKALALVSPDLAVELALTCQAHNPSVRQLLAANRASVIAWLRGQ